ncbi:MAG: DUF4338 domain-containing protein [Deltaproteobacteria bacterium]|nr:DUF4338 domain-containing protein [Deltaproteobacteria bacterium]
MSKILSYRGRTVTQADITFLKDVIAAHPDDSRCALSRRVCKAWEWTQPNGQLKDMVCRGLLLHLEREGYIIQPPPKRIIGQYRRKRPEPIEIDTTPINVPLKKVRSHLHFKQVRRTPDEKLFNSLIEQYHYLNYAQPVGEHLKYIVFCEQRPVACLAFSSAAFALNVRDGFIGWSKEQRDNNRHLLAYNTRFLILPWIQVKFLASHLLSFGARRISSDWEAVYNHPIYWLETFVDTERFAGTCYKASNWHYLGQTKGRGKYNKSHNQLTSIKDIYGLPLDSRFRDKLCL